MTAIPMRLKIGAALLAPFVIQVMFARFLGEWGVIGGAWVLFWVVLVAAGLCVIASAWLLRYAFVKGVPELSWVGLFFYSVSILPLVHGLTTPNALYGPNLATMASVTFAVPLGLIASLPTAARRASSLRQRWRQWAIGWVVALTVLAAVMLVAPDLLSPIDALSPIGLVIVVASVIGCLMLAVRHIRFAAIADSGGPLVIAAAYALVGGSLGVLFGSAPYSTGFWVAHAFDIGGVLAGAIGAVIVYRRAGSVSDVLAPIVAVDPVAALEVGMSPDVFTFIGRLEEKDAMTRDHVMRTAELAIEVAAMMRLPAADQRAAGLVGALHDIGKLRIPDEVLLKPSPLTALEWEVMRDHAALGSVTVAQIPALADLAPAVRAHHERLDGNGYPDGLAGDEIPLAARIVAACDAFDAMAFTRRYREGMALDEVFSIMRQNAGTQWDPLAVQAVINVVSARDVDHRPRLLDSSEASALCECLPGYFEGSLLDDERSMADAAQTNAAPTAAAPTEPARTEVRAMEGGAFSAQLAVRP